jgi:hypothetical protein
MDLPLSVISPIVVVGILILDGRTPIPHSLEVVMLLAAWVFCLLIDNKYFIGSYIEFFLPKS